MTSPPVTGEALGSKHLNWHLEQPRDVKAFYGAVGDGVTDDTAEIQAALDDAITYGYAIFIPAGTYLVQSLTLDFSQETAQADTGTPYGYTGPKVFGAGMLATTLQQAPGVADDVFTIKGQIDTAAGPGNNNKVVGAVLSDLQIVGNGTGGHGLVLRSVVQVSVENVRIRECGDSGVMMLREIGPGTDDEYGFNIELRNVWSLLNATYGFETTDYASTSFAAYNCQADHNAAGGWLIYGVNSTIYGGITHSNTGIGITIKRNSNTSSVNASTMLVGHRVETNAGSGSYEVKIDAGSGHTLVGCTFIAGNGAHCIGLGTDATGDTDKFIHQSVIVGGYFQGDVSEVGQKFIVAGSDSQNTLVVNPRVNLGSFNGSPTQIQSLITDPGRLVSVLDPHIIKWGWDGTYDFVTTFPNTDPAAPAADAVRVYAKKNGSNKMELKVKWPNGNTAVLATEP